MAAHGVVRAPLASALFVLAIEFLLVERLVDGPLFAPTHRGNVQTPTRLRAELALHNRFGDANDLQSHAPPETASQGHHQSPRRRQQQQMEMRRNDDARRSQ